MAVVEDVVVVWLRNARIIFTKGWRDGDFIWELDAVAFAAGLEDDGFQLRGVVLDSADRDVEDSRVDLFRGLEIICGDVGHEEDMGDGFDVLDLFFQGRDNAFDGAGQVNAVGELQAGVRGEICIFK